MQKTAASQSHVNREPVKRLSQGSHAPAVSTCHAPVVSTTASTSDRPAYRKPISNLPCTNSKHLSCISGKPACRKPISSLSCTSDKHQPCTSGKPACRKTISSLPCTSCAPSTLHAGCYSRCSLMTFTQRAPMMNNTPATTIIVLW